MSYRERITQLESILKIDKLSKKYNLKARSKSSNNTSGHSNSSETETSPQDEDPPVRDDGVVGGSQSDQVGVGVAKEDVDCDDVGDDAIDLVELKKLVFQGLPGDNEYRPIVWRLLLNYLPPNSLNSWDDHLERKRRNYNHFIEDLLIDGVGGGSEGVDHPLNPEPESKWQVFFKDNDVLLQIDKDVRRLCPEISFFQKKTAFPNKHIVSGKLDRLHKRVQSTVLESSTVTRKGLGVSKIKSNLFKQAKTIGDGEEREEHHWEVVERILFIYAKLNPGQSYVQGMNEIIGPIYYTLAGDSSDWGEYAEADTFYLFTNLMAEIRDFFIRSLDSSVSGIGGLMGELMGRLEGRDKVVFEWIKELGVVPQYFAFRWITLLMSQEFPLPDVLRIWDSLLSDSKRFDFLVDLGCAMIIHIRSELLAGDFPTVMKLLQNYPIIDVRDILSLASSFGASDDGSDGENKGCGGGS